MAVRQAIDVDMKFEGDAGRGRFAAAARILESKLAKVMRSCEDWTIPHSGSCLLHEIEKSACSNDRTNAVPEVPCVHVTIDLEDSIV